MNLYTTKATLDLGLVARVHFALAGSCQSSNRCQVAQVEGRFCVLESDIMTYEWHALDEATHYKAMAAYYEAQAAEQQAWEEEQRIGQERIERGVCPFCESRAITETGTGGAGGVQANGAEVDVCWTDYRCDECGGEWAME